MMNRMAKKATTGVAPIANTTLQPSFIVPRKRNGPRGGNTEAAVGTLQAGGT